MIIQGVCRGIALCLASVSLAQQQRRAEEGVLHELNWPRAGRGTWFTGDTHEHVQNCDGSVFPPESVLVRMEEERLNVASLLIWNRGALRFTQFVCAVTGEPESISTTRRIMQYGVETSGLDCSKWGHLVGLGIGPTQARIAYGATADGSCADMPGLALGCEGGDGTGVLNAPIAAHFATAPEAVIGYAHSGWSLGVYHAQGFDWSSELLASGFTADARYLDPSQRLAFPNLDTLLEPSFTADVLDHGHGTLRTFMPLLGPIDAALGEAQFFETTYMGLDSPVPTTPPSNWFGLYYKLLSAGLRVSITAGSDRACPLPDAEHPQTSVSVLNDLTYDEWTRCIALGRTSIAVPFVRIELLVNDRDIGSQVHLTGPDARATATVQVVCGRSVRDTLQLLVDGVVVRTAAFDVAFGGAPRFTFEDVPIAESSWVAARLASQRAHTAAVYVIVDGKPVSDPVSAEYWMMWCDAVTKRALERPDLEVFGCQEGEALERIARARRAFQTLRDTEGLDPGWGVTRRGPGSSACRGPISSGVSGPVVAGQPFRLTCVNAPPEAQGTLYVSLAADESGSCVQGATRLVSTNPSDLLAALPVASTRSGFAEIVTDAPAASGSVLHTQFVWQTPQDCVARSCDDNPAVVEPPPEVSAAAEVANHGSG
jgi:hypothetical protein